MTTEDDGCDVPTECDCCQFSPVKVTLYKSSFPREPTEAWYCDLCAGTITSRIATGQQDYETGKVLKVICHVGNAVLAAIASSHQIAGDQK